MADIQLKIPPSSKAAQAPLPELVNSGDPFITQVHFPTFTMSEPDDLIWDALFEFHKNPPELLKDAKVNAGPIKYNYITLGKVVDVVRTALYKLDVIVFQAETIEGLVTRLQHKSGQYIQTVADLNRYHGYPKGQKVAQNRGSALTYARRYSLLNMLFLVADEDTDGIMK